MLLLQKMVTFPVPSEHYKTEALRGRYFCSVMVETFFEFSSGNETTRISAKNRENYRKMLKVDFL